MPELKTCKRRPFHRLPVKCSPSLITEKEAAEKKKKQNIAMGFVAVLFIFCSFGGYKIVKEVQKSNRMNQKTQTTERNTQDNKKPERKQRKNWGLSSCFTSTSATTNETKQLTPELLKILETNINKIAKLLPEISKEKTNDQNFDERYKLFKDFFNSLSRKDKTTLYPLVTLQKLEEFYKENPTKAATYLDKLLQSVQMLIP